VLTFGMVAETWVVYVGWGVWGMGEGVGGCQSQSWEVWDMGGGCFKGPVVCQPTDSMIRTVRYSSHETAIVVVVAMPL
jgi:hypothetical protein